MARRRESQPPDAAEERSRPPTTDSASGPAARMACRLPALDSRTRAAVSRRAVRQIRPAVDQFTIATCSSEGISFRSYNNAGSDQEPWPSLKNARQPLPLSRLSGNRGTGTLLGWAGLEDHYHLEKQPGSTASHGRQAAPETAIVMIGSNDLSEGRPTAWRNQQLTADLEQIVRHLQRANPTVSVFLSAIPPVGSRHSSATWLNESIAAFNRELAENASMWSTTRSQVFTTPLPDAFDAETMTHDTVHLNTTGEQVLVAGIAEALSLAGELPADQEHPPTCGQTVSFSGKEIGAAMASGTDGTELNAGHTAWSVTGSLPNYDHSGQAAAAMIDGSRLPA